METGFLMGRFESVLQRAEERKPVSIPAAIFGNYRQEVVGATIIDRSEHGAKVKVDRNVSLSKVIILVDCRSNSVFECEVRWRQDCYLGVQIIDAYGPARRRRFFEARQLRSHEEIANPRRARWLDIW